MGINSTNQYGSDGVDTFDLQENASYYFKIKADHLLVLTTSDRVKTLAEDLRRYNTYENYLITLAITDGDYVGEDIEGYRVVANGDNVIEVASREIVDEVFLVLDDQRKTKSLSMLSSLLRWV